MQVNHQEAEKMTYHKPEVAKLPNALESIKNAQEKPGDIYPDSGVPHMLGTATAYEADE
jgi:hypothetical protein